MSRVVEERPTRTLRSFLVYTFRNARQSEQYSLSRPLLLALPVITNYNEGYAVTFI
jgi:hypothetical protein